MSEIKVEFKSDFPEVGHVTEEGWENTVIYNNSPSPLLDTDVKVIFFPDDIGGGKAEILDRYKSDCEICSGTCPAVTTKRIMNNETVSVIHCIVKKQFFFIKGIPYMEEKNA